MKNIFLSSKIDICCIFDAKNQHFHDNSSCFLYKMQKEVLHKKAAGVPAAQKLFHLTVISS